MTDHSDNRDGWIEEDLAYEPTTADLDSDDAAEANLDAHLESASAHRAEGETLKGYAAPMATTIRGDID